MGSFFAPAVCREGMHIVNLMSRDGSPGHPKGLRAANYRHAFL